MKELKAVILIFLLLMAAIILQSTLFELLNINHVRPNICLMIIIFAALQRGSMAGMLTGFTAGMLEGFFMPKFGFIALIQTIIGYMLGRFEGVLSIDTFIMKILLVIGATLAEGILRGFGHLIFGIAGPPFFIFVLNVLIECAYNAVLAPFIFFLLKIMRLFKVKGLEPV
ncbi:MAG: rod shape-determining protein MreD [Spirochaetales bacterium]|nr:rod shape-determining protein MreD [Spirochaetales bacterium]